MNSVTQCIILLACVALSTAAVIKDCRCLDNSTVKSVPYNLITDHVVYEPSPYCNKRQVIVTLKSGSKHCLNPEAKFTRAFLQKKKQEKSRHDKTNTSSTTAASTTANTPTVTAAM